jgi:hypothetical protein
MTRWCTARARSSAACRATDVAAVRQPAPRSTAACGATRARSFRSWGCEVRPARRECEPTKQSLEWHVLRGLRHEGVQRGSRI